MIINADIEDFPRNFYTCNIDTATDAIIKTRHMLMGRKSLMKGLLALLSVGTQTDLEGRGEPSEQATAARYPTIPPPNVNYAENESVFGEILRGEAPAVVLNETENALAFIDRTPRAPLHALVIPKKYVKTVFDLQQDDVPMLEEMHELGLDLIQSRFPEAWVEKDYILCFHVPPFNSVNHLHLHVLAPASQMNWIFRYGKYQAETRWCTSYKSVHSRLLRGKASTSYR